MAVTAEDLKKISIRANIVLLTRAASRLIATPERQAAIAAGEEFAGFSGDIKVKYRGSEFRDLADECDDEIASAIYRAIELATTRGGYPAVPMRRKRVFQLVADTIESLSISPDSVEADLRTLSFFGSEFPRVGLPIPHEFNGSVFLPALLTPLAEVPDGILVESVAIPWLAIYAEIQKNPSFIYEFSKHPREFEEFIAASYDRAGWEATLTSRSADGGRDVIAHRPGFCSIRILDQCKAYSEGRKVPANDVRAMAGVLARDLDASKAIITTTSEFAPGVYKEFQTPNRIELKDGKKLIEWLNEIRVSTA